MRNAFHTGTDISRQMSDHVFRCSQMQDAHISAGHRNGLTILQRGTILDCSELFCKRRGNKRGGHRPAAMDDGNADTPCIATANKRARAIDWVDDENGVSCQSNSIVVGLLRQPPVVGTG